jgi:hypothetical protein
VEGKLDFASTQSPAWWDSFFDSTDNAEWGISDGGAIRLALFPIFLVTSLVVLAGLALVHRHPFRTMFDWVTREDSLLEWPQFFCVFAASMLFIVICARLLSRRQWMIGLIYAVVALGTFFVAGEEISWGQRVFGLATPASLETVNHQGELNVHNIKPVQRAFGYVVLVASAYGVFSPYFKKRILDRAPYWWAALLVPPRSLVPAFFMPFAYRAFRALIWPGTNPLVVNFGEGPELCLYFATLFFAIFTLRRISRPGGPEHV